MLRYKLMILFVLSVIVALGGFAILSFPRAESVVVEEKVDEPLNHFGQSIGPLEMPSQISAAQAELGRKLFFDPRLSKDNSVSCQSCHDLFSGGDDGRQFSVGIGGALGQINAPTVFNSAFNFRQFWDGRAEDLPAQTDGPIHNPIEMGTSWPEVVAKLNQDPNFVKAFEQIYKAPVNRDGLVQSLVAFESSLVTLDAPFDRYLRGDKTALSEAQLRGYRKFEQYGCIACHQGRNVGGNMYQTMGVAHNYFAERGGQYTSDQGRFAVTHDERDKFVFKVPSLRNVELTAPYFHDGTEPSLENAIRKMARYQLGRVLPDTDVKDMAEFLKSLTGLPPAIISTREGYGTASK